MRPIKAIGLTALATLIAMALIGVSSAMAEKTQLCKADESPCAEAKVIKHVHEETLTGAKAKLLSSLGNVECNVLFLGDTLGSGAPLVIHGHFTFSECKKSSESCTVSEVSTDSLLEVLKEGHETAKETIVGEVLVKCGFFINCKYNGEGLTGTVKGPLLASSENGEVNITEQTLHKVSGAFCPEKGKLDIATMPLEKIYLGGGEGKLSSTSTSLTTSLKGGGKEGAEITVAEGSKVKDTATLSGENASKAGGTLDYAVYKDKECKELVTEAGKVTVKEGKVPDSEEKELEAGAVYYWQAKYLGDEMNKESTSTCSKEVLTVKAKTTLATKLSGGGKEGEEITVAEGSKVKDQATLSGTKSSTATGTIKYAVYKDKECKELATKAGEGEVKEGKAPASEEKELEAGAVYYWQAEYGGDSLHEASTSTCSKEVLTVKAKTTLATKLSGEEQSGAKVEVTDEATVSDTATLSGTNASTATGTVKYFVYFDEECEELAAEAGEVSVEGGKAPASEGIKLEAGDIYYWQAEYSGDSIHETSTSVCGDEVEVVANNISVTTMLSGRDALGKEIEPAEQIEVQEGAVIEDIATLSGPNASGATGVVRYYIYSDEECKELVAEAGEVNAEGESVPLSGAVTLPAGVYYWQARYYGDSFNKASTSTCGDEIATITEPPITTSLSGEEQSSEKIEVQEEIPVTDVATLHTAHASKATGTVKYFVYSDEKCEELAAEAGEVSVEGASVPASTEMELPVGVYYWQAVYSGDKENPAATSACGTEIEVVAEAISLTTSLSGEEKSGEKIEVQEEAAVSDAATLSGKNASKATGSVVYEVFADSKCETLVTSAGSVVVEGGEVPPSDKIKLTAGTYYWQAHYSGDSVNKESTSACGSEVETVALAPITTSLEGEEQSGEKVEVRESASVSDSAALHVENTSTATGTVTYSIYSDQECKKLVTKAGEVTVEEGKIPDSEKKTLPTGTYYWQAEYSGDLEHEKATSVCGAELQITQGPWIVSVGDSFVGGEGGRWAGNVHSNRSAERDSDLIDALGANAYKSILNRESTGEAIPGCRRSHSAEVFIRLAIMGGTWVDSRNLACSGAETKSRSAGGLFKPGLDGIDIASGGELYPGSSPARGTCPLPVCKGQAKLLEDFAKGLTNGEKIKMVVISIGGNNFGFADVVTHCVENFEASWWYTESCREKDKSRFEATPAGTRRGEIETGIINIGNALLNANFNASEFTLVVQDYPSVIPYPVKFRYATGDRGRGAGGGCPFFDEDAKWANETALSVMNKTVKEAAMNVKLNTAFKVTFMELENAFVKRRLCEENVTLVRDGSSAALRDWKAPVAVDESEWVNQIRNIGGAFDIRESVHPNYWGQLALRNCLRKMYNNGSPSLSEKECVIDAPGLVPKPFNDWVPEPKMKLN